MKLKELLNGVEIKEVLGNLDFERDVKFLSNDSRKATKDSLFIAFCGYSDDVHRYIPDAYEKGVGCFVVSKERVREFSHLKDVCIIGVGNLRNSFSRIAKNFYEDVSSEMKIIGITGTSGKTTTAFAIFEALRWLGKKAGLIGTIEYRINEKVFKSENTTPDLLYIYELMKEMKKNNVEYLVMEVSSHSLALGRVDGINFDICCFTNFSQDHLDFHKTMEEYLEAKLGIFDVLNSSTKSDVRLIANEDIDVFDKILNRSLNFPRVKLKKISLKNKNSDYYGNVIKITPHKTVFSVNGKIIETRMLGIPNVYNLLMAIAVLEESGFEIQDFSTSFLYTRVKGRLETVENDLGITIIIDYAHKPDALENLLKTVRGFMKKERRLITVFGCGGDRDSLKRPIMGRIGANYSDYLVITSDNPRTEDPLKIIKDIEKGIKEISFANYEIIVDRKEAIFRALSIAEKGDCVVIAGKGHEDYQIIGKNKIEFSDKNVVMDYIKGIREKKGYLSETGKKNLFEAISFSLNYSFSLLNGGKKELLIENVVQLFRDYYLLSKNRPLEGSVCEVALEYRNVFSLADVKLLHRLEAGLRTKEAFLKLLDEVRIEDLKILLDKLSQIFTGVVNEDIARYLQ